MAEQRSAAKKTAAKKTPAKKKAPAKQQAGDGAADVRAKIAEFPEPYRQLGERLHEVIMAADPELQPKLYYGMPGYTKGGPVLVFFRKDDRFVLGLGEKAHFEVADGASDQLMPSAWFLESMDTATEERVADIVRGAVA